jgi:hypothetical protein
VGEPLVSRGKGPLLALFGSAAFGDRGLLSAPKRTPASCRRPRLRVHTLI